MAQPESFGGGDSSELDRAFWDVLGGDDVEVELAVLGDDANYPKLWTGNVCLAADPFSGETFREAMVRAVQEALARPDVREKGELALATQALRQRLANPAVRIHANSRVGFRGAGVAQAPPEVGQTAFREVHIDAGLFVIGRLEDMTFDHYWRLKTAPVRHTSTDRGTRDACWQTWSSDSRLGAVAVLEGAGLYTSGGVLVEPFTRLRVPLGEPLLQPLGILETGE